MFLNVQHISKSFACSGVLHDLSFGLAEKQTLAILGRSGCGKTTLLKIIAGLLEADKGQIEIGGKAVQELPPQARKTVYLYQEPLLFPHLNVFENVAFGLRLRREAEADLHSKTLQMLENLELTSQSNKMPATLSGGQRQRVAFGRALIIKPAVLLLDEPFGNLDVETRANMQQLFKKIAAEFSITAVFVTHDLKESVLMGDQLAFMENGKLDVFEHLDDFIQDPRTGMKAEIEFWKNLK
ncbi:MAG: ABC transporter ATP-binding protein [Bacteroidota bacterium]